MGDVSGFTRHPIKRPKIFAGRIKQHQGTACLLAGTSASPAVQERRSIRELYSSASRNGDHLFSAIQIAVKIGLIAIDSLLIQSVEGRVKTFSNACQQFIDENRYVLTLSDTFRSDQSNETVCSMKKLVWKIVVTSRANLLSCFDTAPA
jgi:hypothetical protein